MSANRRDYQALALAFRNSYADADTEISQGVDVALANVVDQLALTNANFNTTKFIQAAQVTRKDGVVGSTKS